MGFSSVFGHARSSRSVLAFRCWIVLLENSIIKCCIDLLVNSVSVSLKNMQFRPKRAELKVAVLQVPSSTNRYTRKLKHVSCLSSFVPYSA
jgi:hypothetical protein